MALNGTSIGIGYPEVSDDEAYGTCMKYLICHHKCKKPKGHPEPCGAGNCPYFRRYKRRCGHETNRPCMTGAEANWPPCSQACVVPKKCGHACKALCSECDGVCKNPDCKDGRSKKMFVQHESDDLDDEDILIIGIDYSSPGNIITLPPPLKTDKESKNTTRSSNRESDLYTEIRPKHADHYKNEEKSATNHHKNEKKQDRSHGMRTRTSSAKTLISSPSPPRLKRQDMFYEISPRSQRRTPPKLERMTSTRSLEEPTRTKEGTKKKSETITGNKSKHDFTPETKKAAASRAARPENQPEPVSLRSVQLQKQPDVYRQYWKSAPQRPCQVSSLQRTSDEQQNLEAKKRTRYSDVRGLQSSRTTIHWSLDVASRWLSDTKTRDTGKHGQVNQTMSAAEIEARARRIAERRKRMEEWLCDDSPPRLYSDEEDEIPDGNKESRTA